MKNSPLEIPFILAGACLVLGMFGCATDDEVQKGYLTPQQTASTPSSETTTTTTTSSDTGSTTSERLPPPSVTETITTPDSSTSTTTTTSTPSASESTTATTTTETTSTETASSLTSTPTPSPSGPSPAPLAKNTQQMGGKSGGSGASIKRSSQLDAVEDERPEPVHQVSKSSERRQVEEELDADEDVTPVKKPSSSGVSSSFSPGTTRVADPTGSAKGVILNVNLSAKFVVIKFQYRAISSVGKVLSVMRNGVKVGQVKITKPIKPPHATADILEGDIQRGDSVE